ncbi:hypothetical protein BDW22DRAFT_482216 [Trametopsis cervina]|nr:hypothetical protein BDW22DRAFT_482216 [Trametopsis cervina]
MATLLLLLPDAITKMLPADPIPLVLLCTLAALCLIALARRIPSTSTPAPAPASYEERKAQEAGEDTDGAWTPVAFDYPRVEPCPTDPLTLKPIPYRPFKWGEYRVSMGLHPMAFEDWFELDETFVEYYRIREARLRAHGHRLVQVCEASPGRVDGGHEAAKELVYEMAEYLSRRYPSVYTVRRREKGADGWYGEPMIEEITVVPVERTFRIESEEPMMLAGLLAVDDLTIMIKDTDDVYYLQAGVVAIPGMWRLQDKIGMNLDDIHLSGTVPEYKSKLQSPMNRFFARLTLDKPVARTNYSFQVLPPPPSPSVDPTDPKELAWAYTMKGPEEDEQNRPGYLRAGEDVEGSAPPQVARDTEPGNASPTALSLLSSSSSTPLDPSRVLMRVERESLRRLPRTGAVVFGIRTYQTPVERLAREVGGPGRLASAVRGWGADVARYKARPAFESILGYLDAKHAEQVAAGLVPASPAEP